MRPLRVLHVPDAVGGNPQGLARAERSLGLESTSVVFAPSRFAYDADELLRPPGTGRARYAARRVRLLARALSRYDVVHFNFGRTMMPAPFKYWDLPLLRRLGKVIAVTFQGDDARRGDVARRRGGHSLPLELPDRYPAASDRERELRVAAFDRYADLIFFLNPDLAHSLPSRAEFVPYAHVVAAAVDAHVPREGPFTILHAPSDRAIKGTEHVVAAVERLRSEGAEVRLELVEGVVNAEAQKRYATADVAVDQLHVGWYGGFAVEAMAAATPVVAWIRDEDLDVIDPEMRRDLPIVRADAASLTEVLRGLLEGGRPALRALGATSRTYVERWHDPLRIARVMTARYEDAAARRRR